jgi:hypothetical protein
MFSDQLHYADPGLISGKHPAPAGLTRMDMMVYTSHRPIIPPNSAHNLRTGQGGETTMGCLLVWCPIRCSCCPTDLSPCGNETWFVVDLLRSKYKNTVYACCIYYLCCVVVLSPTDSALWWAVYSSVCLVVFLLKNMLPQTQKYPFCLAIDGVASSVVDCRGILLMFPMCLLY